MFGYSNITNMATPPAAVGTQLQEVVVAAGKTFAADVRCIAYTPYPDVYVCCIAE
jgi:hypothetical protein